ncbi:MAG: AAA family ATPase [Actinomycetia bacterium]|nr:AAA family ATPase [Actinomycetes bacterium]
MERDSELSTLSQLVDDLATSGGRVVLVRGEAGIGKSTLVTRFLDDSSDRAHVLLGACDDLLTPQPLGPIWDLAREESALSDPLSAGDRRGVMEATLDLLSRSLRPTIIVLEDTQWADEATFDLIMFLGRRIERSNGLLILTYRDAEVDEEHSLRGIIGDLPPQVLVRIALSRLSAEAVGTMINSELFDVEEILALTDGNPLFVGEVLASGSTEVPLSIKDAVTARALNLTRGARQVLDLVSVVPGEVEKSLVDRVIAPSEGELTECVRHGLLRINDGILAFPHELQRRAIEASLTSSERRRLNQELLEALSHSDDQAPDPARMAHHAIEAVDVDALMEFAPIAARTAMEIQSNREAVSHFRTLEAYLDRMDSAIRASLLDDWARQEFYMESGESLHLYERAIDARRIEADPRSLARTLTYASRAYGALAQPDQAVKYSTEAISILDPYGPSIELARALSNHAFLEFFYTDRDDAVLPFVDRAMFVAEEVGDEEAMTNAINVKAHLLFSRGQSIGMTLMEESHERAVRDGNPWGEVRALANMAGMYGDVRDLGRAIDFAQRARDTAIRYEVRTVELEARAMYSEFLFWSGDWARAEDVATDLLGSGPHVELIATRVLALIQVRRGRNEARASMSRMWSLVRADEGATIIDTAAAAIAEFIWISDDHDEALLLRLREVLDEGIRLGEPWPSGALVFWMWKLGLLSSVPEGTADFYGWIIEGDHRRAAEFWRERGIPYEEGLALMHGEEHEQIEAIRLFEDLGAVAIANRVRQTLSESGVTVPRGRSASTKKHVAGLTARQAEVLGLLAEGLTNLEIADRLFVARRTIDNHVSAVLMKLDVSDRETAVAHARDQGLL